jgi:DNA-binding transcriptional LysR family regulator
MNPDLELDQCDRSISRRAIASPSKLGSHCESWLTNRLSLCFSTALRLRARTNWIMNLCRQAGFEPRIVKLADGPQGILELVSAGFGVALVPELFPEIPIGRRLSPATACNFKVPAFAYVASGQRIPIAQAILRDFADALGQGQPLNTP